MGMQIYDIKNSNIENLKSAANNEWILVSMTYI